MIMDCLPSVLLYAAPNAISYCEMYNVFVIMQDK
jgi:hypothetical protein